MKRLACLALLVAAAISASDSVAQDEPNPLIGGHLYRSYCLVCHGSDGGNAGPLAKKLGFTPTDLTSEAFQSAKVQDLAAIIGSYRRPEDSNMPNWGLVLTEAELLDLAAYVSNMAQGRFAFRGDTRQGRVVFKRACVACHGRFGTGRGILAYLIGIPMVNFTESTVMREISDDDLVTLIREGKGEFMPSWKETLSDDQIVDVAAYVRLLSR